MSSNNLHPYQQMISSSAGALGVSLFTTPFDVVKVRLQAQPPERIKCRTLNRIVDTTLCYCQHRNYNSSPAMCGEVANVRAVPRYISTYDAFAKIVRTEGVGKLWRGLPPTLVQMFPQTVIYFTAYDHLKYMFGYTDGRTNTAASLCAGASGRVFAVLAVSPLEMSRTKFQSKKNLKYSQLLRLVSDSIKQEGVLSMWRGIGPTILRDVPFSALYWVMYEWLKSMKHNPNVVDNFMCRAMSGSVAAFLVTPFDVVKTHRQIELGESKAVRLRTKMRRSGLPMTLDIMLKLYRTQGLGGLFVGLVPRVAKVAPSCAIMISTYEYGKKYFAEQNELNNNNNNNNINIKNNNNYMR
jgi:solute carrier family 25 protein 39/40